MNRFYTLLLALLVASPAFAQAAADQVEAELVVAGPATLATTVFNYNQMLPGIYFPQDSSATLPPANTAQGFWIGVSLYTANNDGATGIGVVYTTDGVTAEAVVARRADGRDAEGCTTTSTTDTPPPSDIVNAAALAGKVAMIRRGTCSFVYKVLAAQAAGAIGVVIYNGADRIEADDVAPNMAAPGPPTGEFSTELTIPAVIIVNGIAQPIVDAVAAGTAVTLTIRARQDGTVAAEPGVATTRSGLEVVGSNPFRTSTALRLTTETAEAVRVDVFNVRGQQVATLFDGAVAGERTLRLSSADLAPGVYFVRATGQSFRTQVQLTVVR